MSFQIVRYTFEVAPVFTLMEHEVLEESLKLVGYPSIPEANGILCPGGSLSNMYAMVMARYKILPEIKRMGCSGFPPLACFSSEEGHYSIMKGVHWLGIGTEHVYKVLIYSFIHLINLKKKEEKIKFQKVYHMSIISISNLIKKL